MSSYHITPFKQHFIMPIFILPTKWTDNNNFDTRSLTNHSSLKNNKKMRDEDDRAHEAPEMLLWIACVLKKSKRTKYEKHNNDGLFQRKL